MTDLTKTRPCNKVNMLKWIVALESGEYEQSHGELREETPGGRLWYTLWVVSEPSRFAYCVLGVADEISGLGEWDQWGGYIIPGIGDSYGGTLHPAVAEWLGVDNTSPLLTDTISAMSANDSLKWDFKKIAAGLRNAYGIGPRDENEE